MIFVGIFGWEGVEYNCLVVLGRMKSEDRSQDSEGGIEKKKFNRGLRG